MSKDPHYMSELTAFANAHGVKSYSLTLEKLRNREDIQCAPFTSNLGIRWYERELYYTSDKQWPEAIHELGHLMMCQKDPNEPIYGDVDLIEEPDDPSVTLSPKEDEFDFFGWELAVVHYIEAPISRWLESNHNYGVTDGDELSDLSPLRLHRLLAERLEFATAKGYIDLDGVPLCARVT
jgi:hypothetical protein